MGKELILFYPGELFQRGRTLSFESSRGRKDFPVKEIDSVFCFAQISFVSRVFDFLGNNNIPVFFFSYYGLLKGVFYPVYNNIESDSSCFKIKQVKAYLDENVRLGIAKEFLVSAVDNMIFLLKSYKIDKKKLDDFSVYKEYLGKSKSISELMIREANMRFQYYRLLDLCIKNRDFALNERSYRPPKDPINALISFGNTMLYSFVLAEIFKTDLDPIVSFLHEPQGNRFSLNLDIAEIFKPVFVDKFILEVVNKRYLSVEKHFEYVNDGCYLNKEGKKIFLKYYLDFLENKIVHGVLGRKVSYKYVIRLECYKIIRSIKEGLKYEGFRYEKCM